jgi:hypothetical protein
MRFAIAEPQPVSRTEIALTSTFTRGTASFSVPVGASAIHVATEAA